MRSSKLLVIFSSLLIVFISGKLYFPVHFPDKETPEYFSLEPQENPVKILRRFCYDIFNSNEYRCRELVNFVVPLLKNIYGDDPRWIGFEGDILILDNSLNSKDIVEEWGRKHYNVDLGTLEGKNYSASIEVPQFQVDVQQEVEEFCTRHDLSGFACCFLSFELSNFVTSLYFREGGATLENIVSNMLFEMDAEIAFIPIYLQKASTVTLSYYHTNIQFMVLTACKFCMHHNLERLACKAFVDFASNRLRAYYGFEYRESLWSLSYVINTLETVAPSSQGLQDIAIDPLESPIPVIADFVEIGTSNFETVSQLVNERETLIGFAVEPSLHYLNSLPVRPNVTKVHAAIITEAALQEKIHKHKMVYGHASEENHTPHTVDEGNGQITSETAQYVDLYHIPEEVIDRLGLYYHLKGCNAIGGYHAAQISAGAQQHVVIDKVRAYTMTQFLTMHNIHRIKLLKIDAEGYDVYMLDELFNHMVNKHHPIVHVDRIFFETNDPEQQEFTDALLKKFIGIGYEVIMLGDNTIIQFIMP